MKPTVKIGSLLLAVVMALSAVFATGCSMSKEWSYKTSDKELAIGVYIYCLDLAFQQAQTKAKELDDYDGANDKWLDLEITDDDGNTAVARQWIKDDAQKKCLNFLAVEKLMKDEGASVDEASQQAADEQAKTYWNVGQYANYGYIMPMSKELEPYGISYDSFRYCTSQYSVNYSVLFSKLYGEGGSQEVSDSELETYFTENYVDYSYIPVQLYEASTDEAGESTNVALSEDKIAEYTSEFEGYISDIDGGKSFDDVVSAYTEKHELTDSPAVDNTEQLESVSAGDQIKDALKELGNNKAVTVKVGEGDSAMLYLVYKRNSADSGKDYLESETNRAGVLNTMKKDDFEDYIKKTADDLDYEKNSAVDGYDPKMFFVAEVPTTAAETTASAEEEGSAAEE
ncbi:hypothetical protein [Ruminococcus sp.]|uniref:hypothetical protein n=1 Tax=Ruminococcus sp. TaxID=41978 RepID=UPI002E765AFC|nr:hypothetical protein [Ruminococcus sp.]MEE1264103.1 hypothetical protein [Ruminococcus sp.]